MAHHYMRPMPDPNSYLGKMIQKVDILKMSELRQVSRVAGCTATGRKSRLLQVVRDMVVQNNKSAIDEVNCIYTKSYASRVMVPISSPVQRHDPHYTPSPLSTAPPHRPAATPSCHFRRGSDVKGLQPFPYIHGLKLTTPYQGVVSCTSTTRFDKRLLSFQFSLTPLETATLREETPFCRRVLLRVCRDGHPITDQVPPGISSLKVNDVGILVVQSPEKFEYRHTNRPIDITKHVILEPHTRQSVDLFYLPQSQKNSPNTPWRVSIETVRFDVQALISGLPLLPRAETEKRIVQAFLDDSEVGITTTSINISLKCPLTGTPIQLPCRSSNCTHLQCFDGSALITMGTETQKWVCPICSSPAPYDSLLKDEYFQAVLLSQQSGAISEIYLFEDGHWGPSPKPPLNSCIEIILDCSNSSAPPPSPPHAPGPCCSDPIIVPAVDSLPRPAASDITIIEIID